MLYGSIVFTSSVARPSTRSASPLLGLNKTGSHEHFLTKLNTTNMSLLTYSTNRPISALHKYKMRNKLMKRFKLITLVLISILVVGCTTTGTKHQANVYRADQVNTRQEAKTIQLLAVMPAQISIDNTKSKKKAQTTGAIVGALLGGGLASKNGSSNTGLAALAGGGLGLLTGSSVADTVLVEGVSLTYIEEGKTYTSAQVGRQCEFSPGIALVISTKAYETRIQPNATCSEEKS